MRGCLAGVPPAPPCSHTDIAFTASDRKLLDTIRPHRQAARPIPPLPRQTTHWAAAPRTPAPCPVAAAAAASTAATNIAAASSRAPHPCNCHEYVVQWCAAQLIHRGQHTQPPGAGADAKDVPLLHTDTWHDMAQVVRYGHLLECDSQREQQLEGVVVCLCSHLPNAHPHPG